VGLPVIFVTQALASYERRRLIEQKVPFLVPGNQLYLPDLGVDLREYFRLRQPAADAPLSPATQALLITALLRPHWEPKWHPAAAGARLAYTPMTISRATRELVGAGLADISRVGRSQYLMMTASPRETWERAAPVLRSPVQRTVWSLSPVPVDATGRIWRWAGLSALARRSMLDEPGIPVMAVGRADWQALRQHIEEVPEAIPGSRAWQVWHYSPALSPDGDLVDPLSLILSLRDSTDERVQSALDEVKEQLRW
jgi:DNA-binding MarR family transcriptional regulator